MVLDQVDEREWIEVRRLHDPIASEIAARFLRDHQVPVRVHGGSTRALPSIGLTDIRILVPKEDVARASQVLEALDLGTRDNNPFRSGSAPESDDESYESPVVRRKGAFAFILAWLVPVGAGHFYARHGAAGVVLAAGIVGTFVGAVLGYEAFVHVPWILIGIDAFFSPLAVRRFNAGRVPSAGRQRLAALAAVVVAIGVGLVLG